MLLGIKNKKTLFFRHLLTAIVSGALIYVFWLSRPEWSADMRFWRAVGDASYVLLFLVLIAGPVAKLIPRVQKVLSWRREFGIWFALLALFHGVLILNGWARWDVMRFFGYEFIPQLDRYARLEPGFGLSNLMGIVALIWAIALLVTSSDWAVRKLGITSWKWLHYGAYIIFYLVSLHAIYFLFIHYTISFHRPVPDPNWFRYPMLASAILLPLTQILAFWVSVRKQNKSQTDVKTKSKNNNTLQTVKFLKKRKIAKGTYEILLSVPDRGLNFIAGQYIQLRIRDLKYPDTKGSSRVFSIASSPNNGKEIAIAFRDTGSGYKRTLIEMQKGTEMIIDCPSGNFTLPSDTSRPIVFVAGGIGITPIVSMVRYWSEKKLGHNITLLYANKDAESASYYNELEKLANNAGVKFNLSNIYGRIQKEQIAKIYSEKEGAIWYVVGPPGMVSFVRTLLSQVGVSEIDVIFEDFSGYE